jgi:putative lipoic acid-binding regulatory protein
MTDEDRWGRLRETLDRLHVWPGPYTFKFVVPSARVPEVRDAASDLRFTERASSNGRYVSLTATVQIGAVDEVLDVYRAIEGIPGVVSL